MCDAGMDYDMWDPTTSSGKPMNVRTYHDGSGNLRWETEAERLRRLPKTKPQKPGLFKRVINAYHYLIGT